LRRRPCVLAVKTIVLVHGAFADGSGWKPVADILQSHGYSVRVVQEPETSLAADVAATRRVLAKVGPCVLVGHSYGGMIITETGMHPDVKGLVYVAAIQPTSVRVCLIWRAKCQRLPRASDRLRRLSRSKPDAFASDFAADAPEPVARFMAISQVPVSADAFDAKATVAAWKPKAELCGDCHTGPNDQPDLERFMASGPIANH